MDMTTVVRGPQCRLVGPAQGGGYEYWWSRTDYHSGRVVLPVRDERPSLSVPDGIEFRRSEAVILAAGREFDPVSGEDVTPTVHVVLYIPSSDCDATAQLPDFMVDFEGDLRIAQHAPQDIKNGEWMAAEGIALVDYASGKRIAAWRRVR